MKDLSAISVEVAKTLATEPLLAIVVTWGFNGPIVTYTDKDHTLGQGKIISVSGLDDVIKVESRGASNSLSVQLDDTDGSIRQIMESTDIHKGHCEVHQTYDVLTGSSNLFTGEIASPILWSEEDRTVSFEIISKVESKEIGFSAETGEFDFIADAAIGQAWPLCFGSPLKVPALKLTEAVRGTSLTRFALITQSNLDSLCSAAKTVTNAEVDKLLADRNSGFSDENYAVVISNLTGATIALNSALSSLLFTSPTRETELRSYIFACKNLRLAERNKELYTAQLATFEASLESLNAALVLIERNLEIELNKEKPDLIVVATLQADIELLKFGAAETDGIDDLNSKRDAAFVSLNTANSNIYIFTTDQELLEASLTTIDLTIVEVKGGEDFPQGIDLNVIINGAKFRGSFAGQTFTVKDTSLPTDTNVELATRQNTNANEFWIADGAINLKGKFCYFAGRGVTYIENQQGTNCFMSPILYQQVGEITLTEGITREVFDPILLTQKIYETSVFFRERWKSNLSGKPDYSSGLADIRSVDYSIQIGDDVYLDTDYKDLYIANLIPSTSVEGVFAFRTIDGESKLQPVPSRYFEVNLSETIAGQTATTIRMKRPLGQYVDEQWSEEVFVSLTSSVGSNTASIIDYLVTNYTNLTSDSTTLAAVVGQIAAYPSHFALLKRLDSLAAIQDIAWQARCAVYIVGDEVFYKYLATEEAAIQTITESEILLESMGISFTATEDLITKLIGEWRKDYTQEDPHKVVIRNNVTKYGKTEETYNFFIYNIKELVAKSLTFWMFRLSNTYKIIKFTSFMKTLELQTFDSVDFTFIDNYLANATVKGIIQNANYNSENMTIDYEVLVSVRSGEMVQYTFFWSADATDAYPGPTDIFAGGGE